MEDKREEVQKLYKEIRMLEKSISDKLEQKKQMDYISLIDLQIKKLQTTLADTHEPSDIQGLSMTIAMLAEKAFYMSQKSK